MNSSRYKDTIRLPATSFPMKANLNKLAASIRSKWDQDDIYQKIRHQSKLLPKFILHDGPPYANGHIHLGTALNKILKDIIVKGYQLMGFDAPLVFGWDCHGLPIEWKVEESYKKRGISKDSIDINEFRLECRNFATKWVDIQKEEFKELGIIADFDNPYNTMNYLSEGDIYREIIKFVMNDSLYLGKKPVMWSVVEQTALAEAEAEYLDKVSDETFIGFKVVKVRSSYQGHQKWLGATVVVWTTTPWTIPANEALAYNPKISYGLYEVTWGKDSQNLTHSKLIVAEALKEEVFQKLQVSSSVLIDQTNDLSILEADHPLHNMGFGAQPRQLLAAEFVDESSGSGVVHIAPAYGLDDFALSKKYSLPAQDILTANGCYIEGIPHFEGMHIFKANQSIIESLKNCDGLLFSAKFKHSYPHSWRSKAPLIYRLTSQWFIDLDKNSVRKNVLEAISNDIEFFPATSKKRLSSMIEDRPEWCLSRQRLWGVPIAVFVNKKTGAVLQDQEVYDNIAQNITKYGSDIWFADIQNNAKKFLTEKYNPNDYTAVFDVADVWFDSGSTHAFVLESRKDLRAPADIYIEGSDQHRGWFQSSLIESVATRSQSPYKKLITHGFVIDAKGQKMSKSLGNVITPQEIIRKYGIDILRTWVSNVDYKNDVKAGDEVFKQQIDIYRKIRNTFKYMLGNLTYFKPEYKVEYNKLPELEKYILSRIYEVHKVFEQSFKTNYDLHRAFNEVYNFIASDLSAFYFDIRKDCLYCDSLNSNTLRSALTVMDITFDYVVKWLAPFITYTAEEAWIMRHQESEIKNNESNYIMLSNLKAPSIEWQKPNIVSKWNRVKEIRKVVLGAIEKHRSNKVIGSSLEAKANIFVNDKDISLTSDINFAEVCITSAADIKNISLKTPSSISGLNTSDTWVDIIKAEGEKCSRCWKIELNINNDLCNRCANALQNLA